MAHWMGSMTRCTMLAAFLLATPAVAVRHHPVDIVDADITLVKHPPVAGVPGMDERGTTFIHGVPVYNYHLAFGPNRASSFLEDVKNETRAGVEHWLVFLKDSVTDGRIIQLCKATKKCEAHGHTSGVAFLEFKGTEEELEQLIAAEKSDVEFVEPDMPVARVPEIPPDNSVKQARIKSGSSWGLERIHAGQRKTTGRGVHIYILDTGVRTTHSDFEGRAIPTLELTDGYAKECKGRTTCAVDRDGHGTHCAGVAAGRQHGVAPAATIHAVKVLKDDGRGANAWTLLALDWISTSGERPAVASMSLGSKGTSFAEKKSIDKAVQAGVTVVVAAGNENDDACSYQPSFVPSAITVGATDTYDSRADYSNYGTCVDIFAPGSDIISLGHLSDSDTKTMSGTSMACPHVAGAAALLLESNPAWKPDQVEKGLLDKAEKSTVKGLLRGAPNVLLSVGGGDGIVPAPVRPVPTPTPSRPVPTPTPSWLTPTPSRPMPTPRPDFILCPYWSATIYPDSDGNCRCFVGRKCYSKDAAGQMTSCPQQRSASGLPATSYHFVHSCTTCACYFQ